MRPNFCLRRLLVALIITIMSQTAVASYSAANPPPRLTVASLIPLQPLEAVYENCLQSWQSNRAEHQPNQWVEQALKSVRLLIGLFDQRTTALDENALKEQLKRTVNATRSITGPVGWQLERHWRNFAAQPTADLESHMQALLHLDMASLNCTARQPTLAGELGSGGGDPMLIEVDKADKCMKVDQIALDRCQIAWDTNHFERGYSYGYGMYTPMCWNILEGKQECEIFRPAGEDCVALCNHMKDKFNDRHCRDPSKEESAEATLAKMVAQDCACVLKEGRYMTISEHGDPRDCTMDELATSLQQCCAGQVHNCCWIT